jgi:hypothetical protein
MGKLLISCPQSGQVIFAGKHVDRANFRRSPVFFGQTYCNCCHRVHEWFAREAGSRTALKGKNPANADWARFQSPTRLEPRARTLHGTDDKPRCLRQRFGEKRLPPC